jgi:hypothetical protein
LQYAHFTWDFQDIRGVYPTWNCTMGHVSYAYDMYTGNDGDYTQQQNSNFFRRTYGLNKWVLSRLVACALPASSTSTA